MFRAGLRNSVRGVRFQSTVAKAQNTANGLVQKLTGYYNATIYWGKVTAELSKQVYLKEKLTPPSIQEFEQVYKSLYKLGLEYATKPAEVFSVLKGLKKNDYLNYTAYVIQFSGLFALGEIVGRRQIVGYPTFGEKSHH